MRHGGFGGVAPNLLEVPIYWEGKAREAPPSPNHPPPPQKRFASDTHYHTSVEVYQLELI